MSYQKAARKYLESLNASGYGCYIPLCSDPGLGQGVYEIDLVGGALRLFEKGLAVELKQKKVDVLYGDISKITSHLSAAVFSKASATRSVNVSIPLEICFSEEVLVFEVHLLIYSRMVIVLNELWQGSKS
ncbi:MULTISPECIES: hypothetical protein [unclassified Pseudomonas]|uniref:hypothetical protein n=1 Tax=unclassified Pseudomonas TaxID=196821 RepID=UPI00119FD19E|nr:MULTISPECIES: hypothetical protein [unclassified Pseudomonas]TWC13363.1 hypothetical protein FBY00_1218 [Pseudomonas sp. SJZ075]TWC29661.1 hypothetical protein FBY02_1218 [Pseudomonas sp. SJZ078]TWC50347.1 hypothetical protein FBY11_1208 [Pseudomonas sp. SJZ124]TWC86153.1 hypothetical protein FBY09_12169 [Pseudomonas sp. SJZ101]